MSSMFKTLPITCMLKNFLQFYKLFILVPDLYSDMVEQFDPDIFHMGGDEVSLNCWNATENIVNYMAEQNWTRTEADFVKLWDIFQSKALQRLYKKTSRNIPVIMWTSTLTKIDYVETYLPNDTYVIQIWTTGTDSQISELLERGYRLILSNYDALYLDCGFAGWVTDGNNWCSPYIGWQKVYSNSPASIGGKLKCVVCMDAVHRLSQNYTDNAELYILGIKCEHDVSNKT